MLNTARRHLLRAAISSASLTVASAAGLLRPGRVYAAPYYQVNRIESGPAMDLLKDLQKVQPVESGAIRIIAPTIAEDGANVYLECSTSLPGVDGFLLFADTNPQPLIAAFWISDSLLPELKTRIKLARSAEIWVLVRSQGRFYKATRSVVVTVGGCGVGLN